MSPEPGKTLGNVKKNTSGPAAPQKTSKREPASHYGPFDAKAKQLEAVDVPNKGGVSAEGKKKKLPVGAPIKDTSVAPPPPPPCHRVSNCFLFVASKLLKGG